MAEKTQALATIPSLGESMQLADHFMRSGFFADARSVHQAVVKIVAGRELGFGPLASMVGVHIIEGRPTIGAHLLAALVRRSGRYDYRILKSDAAECEIEFSRLEGKKWVKLEPNIRGTLAEYVENGIAVGKDGKTLKSNWKRSPDDMLFARTISKGYRRHTPDLSCGLVVYVDAELEDQPTAAIAPPTEAVMPDGEVVDASYSVNGVHVDQNIPATMSTVLPGQLDRIDQLAGRLGIGAEPFVNRVAALYAGKSPHELTIEEGNDLEAKLTTAWQAKQSPAVTS